MLTADQIEARRAIIDASPDLSALRNHLIDQAEPVLRQLPNVPRIKALLSRDGGICPNDGNVLRFDPWQPEKHTCPRCNTSFTSERHHAHWARAQHLWLAERAAHLATLHAFTGETKYAERARDLMAPYFSLYHEIPNRDNVLGPTHLFFSTYLESIWVLHFFAAAFLLRECNALSEADLAAIDAIAEEATSIISEFNETLSNRQAWHAAALTALGAWFNDEELIENSITDRYGIVGLLTDGIGADGMWFEGENYHLFALRGLVLGAQWAVHSGAELFDDAALANHLRAALMAPTLTALPDLTFPARNDSRYGVPLSHPAYLETWELGAALLGDGAPPSLGNWLADLYARPQQENTTYDAYLNDSGQFATQPIARHQLSWQALIGMRAEPAPNEGRWQPSEIVMPGQGVAVVRRADRYVSLEGGSRAGGHGHPDRLHLTVHADGVHWLPDPGTGQYVDGNLFWYRSTLAHNAPRIDGHDQTGGSDPIVPALTRTDEYGIVIAEYGDLLRVVVESDQWLLDVLTFSSDESSSVELPWHFGGSIQVDGDVSSLPSTLESAFVSDVHAYALPEGKPVRVSVTSGAQRLLTWFLGAGELLTANGPGLPGEPGLRPFLVRRGEGTSVRMVTLLDFKGAVTDATFADGKIAITTGEGVAAFELLDRGIAVGTAVGGTSHTLKRPGPRLDARYARTKPLHVTGEVVWVDPVPPLDGTLDGFDLAAPMILAEEHHYLRTEDPYPGPEGFSATVFANWDDEWLYLAVEVVKDSPVVMLPREVPKRLLDNEADDIHADSLQIYAHIPHLPVVAYLVRPLIDGSVIGRPIGEVDSTAEVHGRWQVTADGYCMTVAVPVPGLTTEAKVAEMRFDLIVNEMREGRTRRAGQLVWSGGHGWAYLRGDRQDPDHFGIVAVR